MTLRLYEPLFEEYRAHPQIRATIENIVHQIGGVPDGGDNGPNTHIPIADLVENLRRVPGARNVMNLGSSSGSASSSDPMYDDNIITIELQQRVGHDARSLTVVSRIMSASHNAQISIMNTMDI